MKQVITVSIDEAVLLSARTKCLQNKVPFSRYVQSLIVKDLETEIIYKKDKNNGR